MSPFSYLAATRIEAMVASLGATVQWLPVHLPGIVRATKNTTPIMVPAKGAYMMKDLADWVDFLKLPPMKLPENFADESMAFANRVALFCAARGLAGAFSRRHFARIFEEGLSGNDLEVLRPTLQSLGVNPEEAFAAAQSEDLKTRYREATEAAVARGVFGVPTFFVDDAMFVGNDRLDFVVRALTRR